MQIAQRKIKGFRTSLSVAFVFLCSIVTMFGFAAVVSQPTSAEAETTFTLAQVPDTQNEVLNDTNPLLPNRYQWLVNNREALNLKFIAHSGDVVNWGHVDPVQFSRASNATNILDNSGIPYGYAIGNHDTAAVTTGGSAAPGNTHDNLRNTTSFNQTFPTSRFKNVGGTFEPGKVDNMYQTFTAGGKDWLVLTQEMWARTSAINWAKQVVEAHPNHNVIVNTHSFIDNTGGYPTTGIYGDNNPQQVWQQFVSQYPNIKMVLSAHHGPNDQGNGYSYSEATGVNGNKVAQIMTAYHSSYQNHVRLLNIDTANGTVNSSVYVPTSTHTSYPSGYITDGASNFATTGMSWVDPETTEPPVATVPTAPQTVSATAGAAGSGQATVAFAAPTSDGGTPISSYTVTSSPGNITATESSSPITVNGLTAGTSYTFTVTATNSVGASPASSPSNAVIIPGATPPAELLTDPGFENSNGGWVAFNIGTLSRVTSPIRSGTRALKVTSPSASTNLVGLTHNSVVSNSTGGKQYTAQCYARPTTAGLNVRIRFLEYTQNYSSNINLGQTVITSLPQNTWTLVKVTGTATASGKRIIPQIYSTNQTSATGSIVYDDCSVTTP